MREPVTNVNRTKINGREVTVIYKHLRAMQREAVELVPLGIHWKQVNNVGMSLDDETNDFHLSPKGGATLCIIKDVETQQRYMGLAFCRKNEVYNKKIGCKTAYAYAHQAFQNDSLISISEVLKDNPVVQEYVNYILELY